MVILNIRFDGKVQPAGPTDRAAAMPARAMSPSAPLAADTPCVRCAYNLRSLDPAGNCPECGLGIERSLTLGKELADSRPAWIASLAWAARLLLMAQLLPAAAFLLVGAFRDSRYTWQATPLTDLAPSSP